MMARFQFVNYDRLHDMAVVVYRMLMVRMRVKVRT